MAFTEFEYDFYRIIEYDNLTVGNIIWAKRYNNELCMSQIPEGHREDPYIIIGRHEKRLRKLINSF